MKPDLSVARAAAVRAVVAAEDVIDTYIASGHWQVSLKDDNSPVTEVDVAAERAIRSILHEALPMAAFYGEETGKHPGDADARSAAPACWLVDPIDGTKSFIRSLPYFSTQIALQLGDELVLGVSNAPRYHQRLIAVRGEGVWLDDEAVQTRSDITRLQDAYLSSGNLASLTHDAAAWQRYGKLVGQVRRVRGYGDFCHYHQLCAGQADLVVESDVNILDIAALTVAVREAGGVITDLHGRAIDENSSSVLAAASAELHLTALNLLSG